MPVGFNSPARNLFLLGSSGQQVVTNFFETIDKSSTTDGVFIPDEIKYIATNKKYALAGSAADSNSKSFGWLERQDYNLETGGLTTDYSNRIESTQAGVSTTLRAMELDVNDNLIVVGKTGTVPWIARYSNDGVLDWSSTTNSADVAYLDVASDSNGKYYACGRTPLTATGATDTQAFVESFDEDGNPGWGKQAYMLGREVTARAIDANDRGHVVAAGFLEDDTRDKGYIVKINTATGDVMWDRTLTNPDGDMRCTDVFVDSKDQIYVIGNDNTHGYLLKYSAEGNMIWQKKTNQSSGTLINLRVQSDGETEQTIVFGRYENNGDQAGILSKYAKDGRLVFRRMMTSSNNNSDTFSSLCLDADPSFFYFMYTDQAFDGLAGTPDRYTFGKVSSSGNGLGDFQYTEGTGTTIDYEILNEGDVIGRLSDGSVRNDTSDFIAYPFGANKLLFDDLATQVTNKRRQMDGPDSFEYSGSPAIRPADFQELNLLGDEIRTEVTTTTTTGSGEVDASSESKITSSDGLTNDRFALSVAVGDNKIVAGAYLDDYGSDSNQGSVYVYDLDGTNEVKITASDADGQEQLGFSVAVGSNRVVAGAFIETVNGGRRGAAYIFNLDGTGEVKVAPSDGVLSDRFGYSVAVGNDKVVVGSYLHDVGSNSSQGAAYIYDLDGTNEVKITASDGTASDQYGNKVAIGNNKIAVGAPNFGNGVVYLYDLDGTNEVKLTASDGSGGDRFGYAIAIADNKIVVGAYGDDDTGSSSGSVYVYDLDGTNEVKITPSDAAAGDRFGISVAIGNDKVVVGAQLADNTNGAEAGAAYVYDLDGTNEVKLIASDGAADHQFGQSVAVGGNKVVVGERAITTSGGAYVYDLGGTTTSTSTSAIWLDQSGKGNDGVVNGATHNAAGYFEFDGVDDTIETGVSAESLRDIPFTIEAWINITNYSNSEPKIFSADRSSGNLNWGLYVSTGAQLRKLGSGGDQNGNYGSIIQGSWHHVVMVHRNGPGGANALSSFDIYLDSVLKAQNVADDYDAANAFGNVIIGDTFPGRIGEVRIYKRELTADQIFQNYNATKFKFTNQLPAIAPSIGSGLVYDSSLKLDYDFGNDACIDSRGSSVGTTSDPLPSEVKVDSPSGGDLFGRTVAVGEGRIIVGDPQLFPASNGSRACIYNFDGDLVATLNPPQSDYIVDFGERVAAGSGMFAVSQNSDRVHVYDQSGNYKYSIHKPYDTYNIGFGLGLAIANSKLYIGVPYASDGGEVLVYDVFTGAYKSKITSPDADGSVDHQNDSFGFSIAIGEDKIVIGAPGQSESTDSNIQGGPTYNFYSGSAYIFGTDEVFLTKIRSDVPTSRDKFGESVAIGYNRIVVGSPEASSGMTLKKGKINIFELDGTPVDNTFAPTGGISYSEFGYQVAISEDYIFASRPKSNADTTGSVFVFNHSGQYLNQYKQQADNTDSSGNYGYGMAVGNYQFDSKLVIGNSKGPGKIYIYELNRRVFADQVRNLIDTDRTGTSQILPGTVAGATFDSGGYFSFDGTNDEITTSETNTPADAGISGLTVEVWANLSSSTVFGTDGTSWLFGEEGRYRLVYSSTAIQWACATANNAWYSTGTNVSSAATFLDGWHHIVGVYNGEKVRLVLDGTTLLESSTAISGNVSTSGNPRVSLMGTDASNVGWGKGLVGQSRVYSRGLSNTEITQNYNATRTKYGV